MVRGRLSEALRRYQNPSMPDTTSASVAIDVCDALAGAVARARQKAIAIQAELDSLATNAEVVMMQLESAHAVATSSGHDIEGLSIAYESHTSAVQAAVASKRSALETEAVIVDEALEAALSATAALSKVRAGEVPVSVTPCAHAPRPRPGLSQRCS